MCFQTKQITVGTPTVEYAHNHSSRPVNSTPTPKIASRARYRCNSGRRQLSFSKYHANVCANPAEKFIFATQPSLPLILPVSIAYRRSCPWRTITKLFSWADGWPEATGASGKRIANAALAQHFLYKRVIANVTYNLWRFPAQVNASSTMLLSSGFRSRQ